MYPARIRQRYEAPEMEPGETGRATAWTLVAATAALLLALPAWRQATAGHGDALERPQALAADDAGGFFATNRALLRWIETTEARLEDGSPLRRATLPAMQWIVLRWGGVGNETVYAGRDVGRDGWLLFRPGFDHLVGPAFLDDDVLERRRRSRESWKPPLHPDPRPALLAFHRRLAARDVDLLLLPVPTKPAVHPEALARGVSAQGLENPSLGPFLEEMENAGLHVLDPSPILRRLAEEGGAYLRTDSHWTPRAVEAVARAVAREVESLAELAPGDTVFFPTELRRKGRGDLWHLLELPAERPIYAEEEVTVREITDRDGLLWAPSRDAEVLLLGDSFTNVYSVEGLHWGRGAGLAEQLAFELARPVDRIAIQDGSSDQVRRELARDPDRLEGKKVVVYQIATRELSLGDWPVYE